MPDHSPRLAAVLDMGASAIRLVIAQIEPGQPIGILEEATRGVPLGRDAFSTGVIRSETVDTALSALEGLRKVRTAMGRWRFEPLPPAPYAKRATATCFLIGFAAGPGSSSTSLMK